MYVLLLETQMIFLGRVEMLNVVAKLTAVLSRQPMKARLSASAEVGEHVQMVPSNA